MFNKCFPIEHVDSRWQYPGSALNGGGEEGGLVNKGDIIPPHPSSNHLLHVEPVNVTNRKYLFTLPLLCLQTFDFSCTKILF